MKHTTLKRVALTFAPVATVAAAIAAGLLFGAGTSPERAESHPASAIISNGTVMLGVWDEGHLNVPGGTPSAGEGETDVGLRYVPTNNESTAPGCLCEGWGAADDTTDVTGYANESTDGGPNNMEVVSFVFDADSATSVVDIPNSAAAVLRVTHDYQPSPDTDNLYEVNVTIENVSDAAIDTRYRRVMDWDTEPTAFDEWVTLDAGDADALIYTSNNGFETADPLGPQSDDGFVGSFTDAGPDDHGALFDFSFGTLEAGESTTFVTYYGAAGSEDEAIDALAAVGAEAYSFGQPNTEGGAPPTAGEPNTFIFAFGNIGGGAIFGDDEDDPDSDGIPRLTPTVRASATAGTSPTVPAPTNTPMPPAPTTTRPSGPTGGAGAGISGPDTGSGGYADSEGASTMALAIAGAILVATLGAGAVAVKRARR